MPSADYSNVVGGGLKLKGAKDAGVKKKKKKVKPAAGGEDGTIEAKPQYDTALQRALAEEETDEVDVQNSKVREADVREFGKTEAQRRFEERRRKRLDERLKKEGVKTHKERVEELNKYLSRLSEHHDMPKIGPG